MKPIAYLREDLAWVEEMGSPGKRQTVIEQEQLIGHIQRRHGYRQAFTNILPQRDISGSMSGKMGGPTAVGEARAVVNISKVGVRVVIDAHMDAKIRMLAAEEVNIAPAPTTDKK